MPQYFAEAAMAGNLAISKVDGIGIPA